MTSVGKPQRAVSMRARIKSWFSQVFGRTSNHQHPDSTIQSQTLWGSREARCDGQAESLNMGGQGRAGRVLTRAGSFHHAHGFVMHNPVFQETTSNEAEVMRKLTQNVLIGAEFDSNARDPPPRCYEGTRESLIAKIQSWLGDLRKAKKLLWLNGPAGVGKSAIMQTLAEAEARLGRLGASLFFSRTDKRHDPAKVLPTLAFQLALTSPSYRTYIVEQLTLNPLLLNKSIREQFHKLIVEPFALRKLRAPDDICCVLLDGLDECQGEDAQCNLIQLISDFIRHYPTAPIIWVIATRPEEHLKVKFAHPDVSPTLWELHILIDDTEACQDVQHYLRNAFATLRSKYPNATSPEWPSKKEYSKITAAANGLFIFAFTIVLFLGDPGISDPVSQLQIVLRVIDSSGALSDGHPFATLDALYTQILSSLNPTALCHVHRLLGYLLLKGYSLELPDSGRFPYTLLSVSNILDLQPNIVYGALQKLHSVLYIPSRDHAHQQHVRFLHASFADYLLNKERSKAFTIDLTETHTHIWWCYHRVIQQADRDMGVGHGDPSRISLSWPWKEADETKRLSVDLLCEARYFWAHCLVPDCFCYPRFTTTPNSPALVSLTTFERLDILRGINYNTLCENYCGVHVKHVFAFCRWLLGCWNSFHEEMERQKMIVEVPLRDFSLGCVDKTKLAWVSEGNFLGPYSIRHYSNDAEKYHSRDSTCLAMEPLLSEVSSLKLNFPQTSVLVCENKTSGKVAFVVHTTAEDEYPVAFYFLPLV